MQRSPSCGNLPVRTSSSAIIHATLGVPLTRSLSISPPANLAHALGLAESGPGWTFYHYRSNQYRSQWPLKLWRDRFQDCERVRYDKRFTVHPVYRNVPIASPDHKTNYSNRTRIGYWAYDYDYMYELPPKKLFSVFDPFDDEYKRWSKYGSRRVDEALNRPSYYYNKRHYYI